MTLDPDVRDFITDANFAALTTLMPDGQPQTQVMWVDADDEHVIFNTEVHRAKFRNLERDPRVTLCIWEAGNPYRYVEIRGTVAETITGPEAREHIDVASQRYIGEEYPNEVRSERVLVKVTPERIVSRL